MQNMIYCFNYKIYFENIPVKSSQNSGKTRYPVSVKPEPDHLFRYLVPVKPEPEWGETIPVPLIRTGYYDLKIRYPVPVLKTPIRSWPKWI